MEGIAERQLRSVSPLRSISPRPFVDTPIYQQASDALERRDFEEVERLIKSHDILASDTVFLDSYNRSLKAPSGVHEQAWATLANHDFEGVDQIIKSNQSLASDPILMDAYHKLKSQFINLDTIAFLEPKNTAYTSAKIPDLVVAGVDHALARLKYRGEDIHSATPFLSALTEQLNGANAEKLTCAVKYLENNNMDSAMPILEELGPKLRNDEEIRNHLRAVNHLRNQDYHIERADRDLRKIPDICDQHRQIERSDPDRDPRLIPDVLDNEDAATITRARGYLKDKNIQEAKSILCKLKIKLETIGDIFQAFEELGKGNAKRAESLLSDLSPNDENFQDKIFQLAVHCMGQVKEELQNRKHPDFDNKLSKEFEKNTKILEDLMKEIYESARTGITPQGAARAVKRLALQIDPGATIEHLTKKTPKDSRKSLAKAINNGLHDLHMTVRVARSRQDEIMIRILTELPRRTAMKYAMASPVNQNGLSKMRKIMMAICTDEFTEIGLNKIHDILRLHQYTLSISKAERRVRPRNTPEQRTAKTDLLRASNPVHSLKFQTCFDELEDPDFNSLIIFNFSGITSRGKTHAIRSLKKIREEYKDIHPETRFSDLVKIDKDETTAEIDPESHLHIAKPKFSWPLWRIFGLFNYHSVANEINTFIQDEGERGYIASNKNDERIFKYIMSKISEGIPTQRTVEGVTIEHPPNLGLYVNASNYLIEKGTTGNRVKDFEFSFHLRFQQENIIREALEERFKLIDRLECNSGEQRTSRDLSKWFREKNLAEFIVAELSKGPDLGGTVNKEIASEAVTIAKNQFYSQTIDPEVWKTQVVQMIASKRKAGWMTNANTHQTYSEELVQSQSQRPPTSAYIIQENLAGAGRDSYRASVDSWHSASEGYNHSLSGSEGGTEVVSSPGGDSE